MARDPSDGIVDTVVKLGGGILAHSEHLDDALGAICHAAVTHRLLIVPGGGPFAEAVREVDHRLGLSSDATHWMAVLAMDQYAHLIADRLVRSALVVQRSEIVAALTSAKVPVLAPWRWLRKIDPLPHTWDVTSDSIAAWVAGRVGARHVVLIKPAHATGKDLVDVHFTRALPARVTPFITPIDQLDRLRTALRGERT